MRLVRNFRILFATAALGLAAALALPAVSAAGPAASAIQGEWIIQLSEQDKAQFDMVKLALRTPPPTDAEIQALPEEQRMLVTMMSAAMAADPDSPQIKQARAMVAQMDSGIVLRIKADSMEIDAGEVQSRPYSVTAETDTVVTISAEDKGALQASEIRLVGNDKIQIWEGGTMALEAVRKR